jgi:hypothetical protein
MDDKPMLTFLSTTFQACLMNGTSVQESGLKVSAEKQRDENILFFRTDCNNGRKCLNMMEEGRKICDYIVFYTKNQVKREVVCFLELKGSREDDAIRQVLSTQAGILALIKSKIGLKEYTHVVEHVVWKVCICLHGQTPTGNQRAKEELLKKFGTGNVRIKYGVKHFKLLADILRE